MKVERFMSHTTDDDDRRYRPVDEVEQARLRDPVITFGNQLLEHGVLSQQEIDETAVNALAAVDAATDAADSASPPDVSTLHQMVYSGQ
jgi:TPP-dependent pyruvate/acetoin dehydrogenase alpha subunit